MIFRRRFLLAGLLPLAVLCAVETVAPGLDAAQLARIPVRLKVLADRGEVAGAVMLVAHQGKVVLHDAVGWQDIESQKPMQKDSLCQIMSMTKPVTAVGVMMLAEEGRLALTDPVEKHLPEFRGQMMVTQENADGSRVLKRPSRPITIRDLMTHTSGMIGNPPEGLRDLYTRLDRPLAEAVSVFSQTPLQFEPGSRWQYSNPGIAVLGRIIEVAGDQPYEAFLQERLFTPLGMKDTHFYLPADKTTRVALVYKRDASTGKLVRSGGNILGGDPALYRKGARFPAPEFGLYSTATDLFAFYQMLLDGGTRNGRRYLSPMSIEVMSLVHTGPWEKSGHMGGSGYGLAWEVVKDPLATLTMFAQGDYGHGGAFGTQGWISPSRKLVRVLLIQGEGTGGDARAAFLTMSGAAVGR